jgi:hypothetical protein
MSVMNCRPSLVFSAILLLFTLSLTSFAQRRRFDVEVRRNCEVDPPLTKLEDFNYRLQTVIVRGSTHVMTLTARSGFARVDAIELRDEGNADVARGVVITLRDTTRENSEDARSYIDYEEIDRVIAAWDRVAKTDDTITKLNNFESRYRTKGDFEISVFRQVPGGAVAATVSAGLCERVRLALSIDELVKLRHMVAQGKERLDDLK